MRYRIPFFAVLVLGPLAAQAQPLIQSQEGIALQNEILQLRQQVQQISAQKSSGDGSSSLGGNLSAPAAPSATNPLLPSLLTQVQQLQAQVQTLNGQVSELQHDMQTQNAQTQKEIGDLKFQMTNGGATPGATNGTAPAAAAGAAASASTAAKAAAAPAAPPAATIPSSPREALKAAIKAYERHDYRNAAVIAQQIVTKNKEAPEAYRAQYLLAQSYAAQDNAKSAAVAYYGTYSMNKSGTYAPRALLGLANSLADLRQNQEACETISSLNSQFTSPSVGMRRDIDRVAERAHCH